MSFTTLLWSKEASLAIFISAPTLPSKPTKLNEIGESIHQLCYDNVPYLFLWSPEPMCFYRNTIRDLTVTPMEFFSTIRTWGVENRD